MSKLIKNLVKSIDSTAVPPCMLNGLSLVGNWYVNNDRFGLKIIIGLFDADWAAIHSSLFHFHSSAASLWFICNAKIEYEWTRLIEQIKTKIDAHTLILMLEAATKLGTVIGDGHEIKTRTDAFTTFGKPMSSNVSVLDCFKNIFCVAMYSLRKDACWAALCRLDGRRRCANAVTASSTFFNVIACLLSV